MFKKSKIVLFASLLIIAFIFACKKKDKAVATPAPTTTGSTPPVSTLIDINSTPQVSYVLDGGPVTTYVSNGSSVQSDNSTGSTGNDNFIYSTGLNNGASISYIGIAKGTLITHGMGIPTDSVFKAFFPIGIKPYSSASVNGIEVSMYDANHVSWKTSLGTADQTGSTFSIDQVKDNGSSFGYYLKVKILFSCKLYDANGHVKILTNGIYVGDFGNY